MPERAPRPGPSPLAGLDVPKLWEILKWASLGMGGLFLLVSFVVNAFWAGAMAGTGCFFAIVSRIMQAEQHRAGGRLPQGVMDSAAPRRTVAG